MKIKTINIDSSEGGNGDIWMRLVSFYSLNEIIAGVKISFAVPDRLYELAKEVFGDRLQIKQADKFTNTNVLKYTSKGLRDLLPKILIGKKFIVPYQKTIYNDKKSKSLKDEINNVLFQLFGFFGFLNIPIKRGEFYQGYHEIISINALNKIDYNRFVNQMKIDHGKITKNLNKSISNYKSEIEIPSDLKDSALFFANGTAHQFVPVWWAKKYLPKAYYGFFQNDSLSKIYLENGLKVVYFYQPKDIVLLANTAKHVISTDSFPSHLLQFSGLKCTIALTEAPQFKVVAPVFQGNIVKALATCHPCLHLERVKHPLCANGHKDCLNWSIKDYNDAILHSLS